MNNYQHHASSESSNINNSNNYNYNSSTSSSITSNNQRNMNYHQHHQEELSPNNNQGYSSNNNNNQQYQQQQTNQRSSPTPSYNSNSNSNSNNTTNNNNNNSYNHHHHNHNNHDTIVSHDSCLSQHENKSKVQSNKAQQEEEEEKQVLNSNNELFFFVMTPEEMKQFMERVDGFVRERKAHQALSLLANKAKNFQTHLEDLMGQHDELIQKTRESKLKFQLFDDIKNYQQSFYHDQERLRQLNDTIYAVRSQLISLLLKKVEMLLPMQLEQEAERDLKIIFQIDPQNDTANRYVAQLEKQIQEKMYREEQERLAKLQQEQEPNLEQGITERKRTNTLYDFSEDCEELECPLCYRVFYEPVTLSCGHTFDRSCICRVHDYSDKCPLCRQTIHVVPYDYPITVVINELCQKYCKAQYEERKKEMEEEVGTRQLNVNHIPIFVLDFVLYPHTLLPLHIFEPRYRLMMRRCMSGSKCFGLVCCGPNRNGDIAKYGCIAKITSFKMLPDGRSIIETVGTERFKILEKWDTDGYICAKVQILKDKTENEISVIENSQRSRDTVSTVMSSSSQNNNQNQGNNNNNQSTEPFNGGGNIPLSSFASLAELQTNVWRQAERMTLQQLNDQLFMMVETFMMEVGDETKQAILQKIGSFPKENEPEKLSFWVSAMLPLTTQLKLDLLSITNTKERLRVLLSICRQIAQSQQTGCSVQ